MPKVTRDEERITRVSQALVSSGLDALVCTLPSNVLMLSGYWPVIGSAIAIATREGYIAVVAPEDEQDPALGGWADSVRTFSPAPLNKLTSVAQAVCGPLSDLNRALRLRAGAKIGFEGEPSFDPAGYASTFIYGAAIQELLQTSFASN